MLYTEYAHEISWAPWHLSCDLFGRALFGIPYGNMVNFIIKLAHYGFSHLHFTNTYYPFGILKYFALEPNLGPQLSRARLSPSIYASPSSNYSLMIGCM